MRIKLDPDKLLVKHLLIMDDVQAGVAGAMRGMIEMLAENAYVEKGKGLEQVPFEDAMAYISGLNTEQLTDLIEQLNGGMEQLKPSKKK